MPDGLRYYRSTLGLPVPPLDRPLKLVQNQPAEHIPPAVQTEADPALRSRARLFDHLRSYGGSTTQELARFLGCRESEVCEHLGVLVRAGLIYGRWEGDYWCYNVSPVIQGGGEDSRA